MPRGHRPLRVPLMMPLSMRPGPTLFTFASYTLFHFLVLSRCSLLTRDPRTSFLALFLEGFSDPRVQGYHMYSRSEAILLQRQKSVRLFAPIRGPTCGMEENHMRKVFIEDNCKTITKIKKNNTCVRFSLRNMLNTEKWKMLKCRIYCPVLQKYNPH